jgi:hypothetical protein
MVLKYHRKGILAGIIMAIIIPSAAHADLVASYNFNGQGLDSSGNGYHLTNSAGLTEVTYSNDTYNGQDQSAVFNNNSAFAIDKSYSQPGEIEALSVSVRFKTSFTETENSNKNSNWSFLDFDRSEYFSVSISGQGELYLSFNGPSISIQDVYSQRADLNDGNWHHAYISYGVNNGLQMSIDSILDTSKSYRGPMGTGSRRFGFIGDGSEASRFDSHRNNLYYDGKIDDLSYYSHENALSQDDLVSMKSVGGRISDVPAKTTILASFMLLLSGAMRFRNRV